MTPLFFGYPNFVSCRIFIICFIILSRDREYQNLIALKILIAKEKEIRYRGNWSSNVQQTANKGKRM